MTPFEVHDEVLSILQAEARWKGPMPKGALDQHLDSMQRLALIVAIEDRFQICFDPDDEDRIRDLDDLLASVVTKVKERE